MKNGKPDLNRWDSAENVGHGLERRGLCVSSQQGGVQGCLEVRGSTKSTEGGRAIKTGFMDFSLLSANTARPVPNHQTPSCLKNRSKRK